MALNLKTDVRVVIKDGEDILLDCVVSSKSLLKKDRKKISKIVSDAQNHMEDDAVRTMEDIEKVSKMRFDLQISGECKDKLREIAEEYGYAMILGEIDDLVRESQGKQ
jgi:chloramphenicol O-acetyltransferase